MAKANRKDEEIVVSQDATNVEVVQPEETIVMGPALPTVEELMARVATLEAEKDALTSKVLEAKPGRKSEVLDYLQKNGHVRVSKIALALGISERNVSSQMTYLRKDGHCIATDSRGYKFLELAPKAE